MNVGRLKKAMSEFDDDVEVSIVRDTVYFGSGPLVIGVLDLATGELIHKVGIRDDDVSPNNDTWQGDH